MSALAILGPTASGKSALALELAHRRNATCLPAPRMELFYADSMAVYRGMDIGTAKPTLAEQTEVAHHLIDLVEPSEPFTVVDYQESFDRANECVRRRNAQPVLVGGSGLYLRAVIDRLTPPTRYPDVVAELVSQPTEVLFERLRGLDPVAAGRMEPTNRRRVLRALEVTVGSGQPFSSFGPGLDSYPDVPYTMVGIDIARPKLDERIKRRYDRQLQEGFVDEVRRLLDRPGGLSRSAAQALGYKELVAYLRGETSLDEAMELAAKRTRRFARRQQRWFARDPRIVWIPFGEVGQMADQVEELMAAQAGVAESDLAVGTTGAQAEELAGG